MDARAQSSAPACRHAPRTVVANAWKKIQRVVQSFSDPDSKRTVIAKCGAAIALVLSAALPAAAQTASTKFIPTFLVYYGGGPALTAADAPKLAKFDLIDIDRFRYTDIGSQTWAAIKAVNPNTQIYLYEDGVEVHNLQDSQAQVSLNNLGRYNVSRGHPMGSLNGNQPGFFQQDAAGNRIYNKWFSNTATGSYYYLLDFGSSAFQSYWVTAVKADVADQPWKADGVFVDLCMTFPAAAGYNAVSAWYSTDAAWSTAMNTFSSAITAGLHGYGQKLWCNKGDTRSAAGRAAWLALDASTSPPDVLLEEGAFAVMWGNAVQFYQEAEWKNQVDTMVATKNSKIAMMSHTQLEAGQTGTDNFGKSVSYWQALWYSLGSFALGKNDTLNNAYFMFNGGSGYNKIWWFDEYDKIDLGKALGSYTVTSIGGVNVYSREFEKGYVYVNPTASDVASVTLPQASRLLSHDNILLAADTIAAVSTIPLKSHNAAILLKTTATTTTTAGDTSAPSVPAGLTATAVSATQVNLTWTASTDNVGVTGYYVYLNDVALTTTTGTSFQHAGLTAGTTYSYRVSAFDAVPNHSAWSATPVSATTLVATATDTTAPSVPAGLTATAASATQVNLTWTASTDNVGVTGYRVYRAGTLLATLGAVTSYQSTGLSASSSYAYTVQANDAAGNASAQSAPASAITLATADSTAPSVPAGLAATAASATQVNLAWTASTDNVGVKGYYVYVNDVALTTTTGTSFQHAGLIAGTTYSYRVSAFDAVPNHSAWTATPVSAKTLAAAATDSTPPSVPAALKATAVSATQIKLTWTASTDNVGVKGYRIYVNNVALTTTTGTSIQLTGLASNTVYSYRVSAFDAVPNNSAWTATPVSARTFVSRLW